VFARSIADGLEHDPQEHDPQEPARMHASPDAEEEEEVLHICIDVYMCSHTTPVSIRCHLVK
jgi:hypothetical protein